MFIIILPSRFRLIPILRRRQHHSPLQSHLLQLALPYWFLWNTCNVAFPFSVSSFACSNIIQSKIHGSFSDDDFLSVPSFFPSVSKHHKSLSSWYLYGIGQIGKTLNCMLPLLQLLIWASFVPNYIKWKESHTAQWNFVRFKSDIYCHMNEFELCNSLSSRLLILFSVLLSSSTITM